MFIEYLVQGLSEFMAIHEPPKFMDKFTKKFTSL